MIKTESEEQVNRNIRSILTGMAVGLKLLVFCVAVFSFFMLAHFDADLKRLKEANTKKVIRSEYVPCNHVCHRCGWKPRDDGPMNNADTCEPLVAITRIDGHECKNRGQPSDVRVFKPGEELPPELRPLTVEEFQKLQDEIRKDIERRN